MALVGGNSGGGLVARQAVIRWALRLFRREWRQQILVLGLVTVAVAGAVAGSAVAYGQVSSRGWEFGDASLMIRVSSNDDPEALDREVTSARDWFGTAEPIWHTSAQLPGWDGRLDVRSLEPDGVYSSPTLDVVQGRYPSDEGEIAFTDTIATLMGATVGDQVELLDQSWHLVGLVENPGDFGDEFAYTSPAHAPMPNDVEILVDADPEQARSWPRVDETSLALTFSERGPNDKNAAAETLLMIEAIVLLLVALVSTAGFVVMAQRRQRQIGLLAATGATNKHLRLVILANGIAVGAVGALIGTLVGLTIWFAMHGSVERSAGHRIDRLDLPWLVIVAGGALAVVATAAAAWWPARTVARLPVTAALSGRPPEPQRARRTAIPGLELLTAGAGAIAWANPPRYLAQRESNFPHELALMVGAVAISLGVLLICPLAVRLVSVGARQLPLATRLAVRDLARYRARSSAALAAISLALGIPIAIVLLAETTDKRGDEGNLSDRQLLVSTMDVQSPVVVPEPQSQLDRQQARIDRLAAGLDDPTVLVLEKAWDPAQPPEPGFEDQRWSVNIGVPISEGYADVPTYVATPQVLAYLGLDEADVPPGTEVLTTETGELVFTGFADPGRERMQVTHAEALEVLPYSSAPQTFVTEGTVRERGWNVAPVGWFVESSSPFTDEQLGAARQVAAEMGFLVQARTDYSNSDVRAASIAGGMALALAIVAMTVGLIRSEAADDLRTLTATGASSRIRRSLTAATAGALGLLGVLIGGLGAYVGLVAGYFREPNYLGRIPVFELLLIGVGMPLLAAAAGWMLGGREPSSLLRPRMPMASLVVLFALVFAVGACGADDDDDPGLPDTNRVDAADRDPLPLQEWEDAIVGTGEERLDQERQVEQAIADCMAAQGFAYIPSEPHPGVVPDPGGDSPWSLSEADFAEQYGYGLFTIDDPGFTDPNAALEASLSDAEFDAYLMALEGTGEEVAVSGPAPEGEGEAAPAPAPEGGDEAPAQEGAAPCQDQAWIEVLGDQVTSEDFATFGEEIDALTDREEADPRIEDAAREWADCMAEEGPDYDVEVPDDAVDLVLRRYLEVTSEGSDDGDSDAGIESIDVEGQDRQVYRLAGVDLASMDDQALQTMRTYEIGVATADYSCRADYDEVRYEVVVEYEEEFVEEHRAELEQFRDAAAANAGGG